MSEFGEPQQGNVAFPTVVTIAAIIWLVAGAVALFIAGVNLLLAFGISAGGESGETARGLGEAVCPSALSLFVGAVFLQVGWQTIKGTAKDTLGNGIGSIIFSLFYWTCGVTTLGMATKGGGLAVLIGFVIVGLSFLVGIALLVGGVLALVGRPNYKAWRQAQKAATTGG